MEAHALRPWRGREPDHDLAAPVLTVQELVQLVELLMRFVDHDKVDLWQTSPDKRLHRCNLSLSVKVRALMAGLDHANVVNPFRLEGRQGLIHKIDCRTGKKRPLPLFNRASHHVSRYQRLPKPRRCLKNNPGMTMAHGIANSVYRPRLALSQRPKPRTIKSFRWPPHVLHIHDLISFPRIAL